MVETKADTVHECAFLRLKRCNNDECAAMFTICASCYRGQRYCSPKCRASVRRQQRKQANRRYQESENGRTAHRACQQRYRERTTQELVTDQGIQTITTPVSSTTSTRSKCAICGRYSRWIDPFPILPRETRRGKSSKKYAFG